MPLYVLRLAEITKKDSHRDFSWISLLNTMKEKFFQMPSAQDFMREIENLKQELERKEDGFEIVVDHFITYK